MRKILLAVIVLLTMFQFIACSKSKAPASDSAAVETGAPAAAVTAVNTPLTGKRIGVAQSTLYDDWNTGVHDEFIRIGKEYGVAEMNVQDGNGNAETQQRQVEDFISQKYDVIFIAPVGGSDGIKSTLDKASDAGIPVIAFDLTIDWPPLVSHIAWDHAETGRLSGRYVVDYAKKIWMAKLKSGSSPCWMNPRRQSVRLLLKKNLKGAWAGKISPMYLSKTLAGPEKAPLIS